MPLLEVQALSILEQVLREEFGLLLRVDNLHASPQPAAERAKAILYRIRGSMSNPDYISIRCFRSRRDPEHELLVLNARGIAAATGATPLIAASSSVGASNDVIISDIDTFNFEQD